MKKTKPIKVRFLGTSSGEALPRPDCDCAQCISPDKKDKRRRSSILINKKILIDAGPDIIKQLRKDQIANLELVLITHEHFDHTGGIKDLLKIKRDLEILRLKPGQHFKWQGIDFYAFKIKHSEMVVTVGIAIGSIIYIPDLADLVWAEKNLKDAKIAILDGSVLNRNFGGHLSINEIINQTKNLKNLKKIYFTHNGHTHHPHQKMVKLVQALGGRRFTLAYDKLELKI